jgi:molybdopterin-binding protein
VKVTIPVGSKMASVMTVDSLEELALKPGDEVEVVVKAVSVLSMKR